MLEWTGHGIPWLAFTMAKVYPLHLDQLTSVANVRDVAESDLAWLLVLFALLIDLGVVGMLKSLVKRPRPSHDKPHDMRLTVKVDNWSFPSGHATRSSMLHWLLYWLFFKDDFIMFALLALWALIVSFSRVAMGRHHVSDVICGYLIGFAQSCLVLAVPWHRVIRPAAQLYESKMVN